MFLACLDLEGVLVPEIWIGVAERTGIDALRATTREIPDYDVLMRQRLRILDEHGIGISEFQEVIGEMRPWKERGFLGWLKDRFQVIILSDTFMSSPLP
ncbi:MAG: bifunctional phosphoserine phosphatase/homoserine phosphotransferase ThrH [Verrucomicrobiales bacterium]